MDSVVNDRPGDLEATSAPPTVLVATRMYYKLRSALVP